MSGELPFQPLPSEIRRRQTLAEDEAVFGVQWIDECPVNTGRRVGALLERLTTNSWLVYYEADAHRLVGSESSHREFDTRDTLEKGRGNDSDRLDAVAAVVYAFVRLSVTDKSEVEIGQGEWAPAEYDVPGFLAAVNDVLLGARIDWHFSDGQFVQRGNSVLHADIVKPATILLADRPKFARASAGFQTAINRLSNNQPDVAITDAASAVQEFFRALGVNGNSISDQLNAAERARIISPVDKGLMKPLTDWVNGDRSNRGNAHHHREGDVTKADAWLMIHVAGALMVRLSNEEPRDIIAARERREAEAVAEAEARAAAEAEARAAAEAEVSGFKPNASGFGNGSDGYPDVPF